MSSIKGLLETLDAQHPGVNLASPTHCSFLNCLVKPTIFFGGLVTNILLILIVYKNKHTKSLSSSKPLRYLLIGMLVSDVWFLIEEINVWFFSLLSQPDLSSYNGTCQIYTYLEHFFAISLEAYMLFADYILLSILFKKKKWAVSPEDIYNQFMVPTIKSHNDANNNEDSEIMMSERSQSLKSTAKKRSIISSRGIDLRKTFGRRWKRILLNGKEKKQLSGMVGAGKPGECRPISECDEVVEFCGSTENRVVETASRSGVGNVSASESAIDPNECSTNDVYAIANEVASNPQNGQPGRRVTYREVHSTQKRSSHHKQRKSQFFVLLDTTKFKNENIYYNILIKEKVVIILWIFICLYLLSFLLWIRGDSSKMGSRSSRSSVIENIVSSTTVATLARSTKRSGGSRIKNST
jgi:preprotein translocase subunit SecG